MDSKREDDMLLQNLEILNFTQYGKCSLISDLIKNVSIENYIYPENYKFSRYTIPKEDSANFRDKESPEDVNIDKDYKTLIEKIKKRVKSPLITAIQKNDVKVVKQLLNNRDKSNLTYKTVTPLLYAAKYGHLEIVKLLFSHGYQKIEIRKGNNRTPLYFAVKNSHVNIVKYLVENDSKINLSNRDRHFLARKCILNNRLDILKCLIDSNEGINYVDSSSKTLLHYSAANGYLDILKYLIECGAEINVECKESPLHCAVKAGHVSIIRELLVKGTDFPFSDIIHIAAEKGSEQILKILLEAGYSVESYFNGRYPIHVAAAFGHWKLIRILIKSGADINSTTQNNETPLHVAIAFGQLSAVKFLLYAGADPVGKNLQSTPLHYILNEEKWRFREYLNMRTERQVEILRCLLNFIQEKDLELCLMRDVDFLLKLDTPPKLVDVLLEYGVSFCYNIISNLDILDVDSDSKSYTALVDNIMNMNILVEFLNLTNLALTFSVNVDIRARNKKLCELLVARIVLMKLISQNFTQMELESIQKGILPFKNYYKECTKQILSMRDTKIHPKFDVTYYDILTKSINQVSIYVRNENLLIDLYSKYSVYSAFLKIHVEKGKERRNLIETSYQCLFDIVVRNHKIQLPLLAIMKIFDYLSVIHLRKLVAAYF
ncbi:putative ankyrin repeat protein RF_0381 [Leptopilina boulardi]|uniref:putative ankyrin repeat protein RF_0381 n=1 Tax=Leptopilina boulardi TaxID=63433 RepID=UPI0021F5E9C7|nr:putative ankyrin repeat protein RF_0381 [Leptopilina boulardi]